MLWKSRSGYLVSFEDNAMLLICLYMYMMDGCVGHKRDGKNYVKVMTNVRNVGAKIWHDIVFKASGYKPSASHVLANLYL